MRASIQQANDEVADRDAEISMIVAMGFTVQGAREALEATDGDIDDAIDYLLAVENSLNQITPVDNRQMASDIPTAGNVEAVPNEPEGPPDSFAANGIETASRHESDERSSGTHVDDLQTASGPSVVTAAENVKTVPSQRNVSVNAVGVERARSFRIHQFDVSDDAIDKPPSK